MYVKRTKKVYHCKNCKIKIAVSDIEGIYWDYLSDCLMNINMVEPIENSTTNIKEKQTLIKKTKNERVLLEITLRKYVSMRMDGEITGEKFVENLHLLQTQLLQVEESLLKAQSEMELEQLQIKSREVLFNKVDCLIRDWHSMPFENKRSIVESVTEQVSIGEKEIRIKFSINLSSLFHAECRQYSNMNALPCLRFERKTDAYVLSGKSCL
jgi:hypothetical protein